MPAARRRSTETPPAAGFGVRTFLSPARKPSAVFPHEHLLWPFVAPQSRPAVPFWAGVDGINVRLWSGFSAVVLAVTLAVVMRDIRREARRADRV